DSSIYYSQNNWDGLSPVKSKDEMYHQRTFESPLKSALISDRPAAVELFEKYGLNFKKECRPFFIFEVIEHDLLNSFQYLLSKEIDLNAVDSKKNTLLHMACSDRRSKIKTEIIQQLLKSGLNPNAVNKDGETPLITLASLRRNDHSGESHILNDLNILLEKGADPEQKNQNGKNSHMIARENEKYIDDKPISIFFSGDRNTLEKFIRKNKIFKLIWLFVAILFLAVIVFAYLFGPNISPTYTDH
ncbi:MAG: ankyrin repeat domain-containing protein, partial [Spirochaetia bacterium]|nr:ankyrin repeat domain-containing protein [Spirochaetia bacterium]